MSWEKPTWRPPLGKFAKRPASKWELLRPHQPTYAVEMILPDKQYLILSSAGVLTEAPAATEKEDITSKWFICGHKVGNRVKPCIAESLSGEKTTPSLLRILNIAIDTHFNMKEITH